ncbi:MAG: PDZ domain-containing protein [Phycisphaera sp.]|nr:PDZ domain-containing protein [Phycisphaera sp.]
MGRQLMRVMLIAGLLAGAVAVAPAIAQSDALARSERVSGSAVTRVFEPAVKDQRACIVSLRSGRDTVAFGTIVAPDGLIVTKASELKDDVVVETREGRSYTPKVVGTDADNDLALLKIDAENLTPVKWSDAPVGTGDIGRWVITPSAGRRSKLKVGVISANRRAIEKSGGVLGVRLGREDAKVQGVRVVGVAPNSAAAAAHIMENDAITHVNGEATPQRETLVKAVSAHAPGETVKLTVLRGEKTIELEAKLGYRHGTFAIWDRNLQLSGRISNRAFGFDAILQHDTTLGPDEMGGPLYDLDGNAVGLNIARVDRSETFALPADVIRPIVDRLIAAMKTGGKTEAVSTEKAKDTTQ